MRESTHQPELIITLSHDHVHLRLKADEHKGRRAWEGQYAVSELFVAEEVASAMDKALEQNEDLFDPLDSVGLLILDRPNVLIPPLKGDPEQHIDILSRYLRLRHGDTVVQDPADDQSIYYTLPEQTYELLTEYFADVQPVHFLSLISNALNRHLSLADSRKNILFFLQFRGMLIALQHQHEKWNFAKLFRVQEQSDVEYFALAIQRMVKPAETWQITLADENQDLLLGNRSFISIHQQLDLPALGKLFAFTRS